MTSPRRDLTVTDEELLKELGPVVKAAEAAYLGQQLKPGASVADTLVAPVLAVVVFVLKSLRADLGIDAAYRTVLEQAYEREGTS